MKRKLLIALFLLTFAVSGWCQFQTNVSAATMVYHDVCIEPLSFNSPQTTDYMAISLTRPCNLNGRF